MDYTVNYYNNATHTLEMTRVYAWFNNVNLIKPSPSGEGGLPKRCKGKTDEGKTTIFLL